MQVIWKFFVAFKFDLLEKDKATCINSMTFFICGQISFAAEVPQFENEWERAAEKNLPKWQHNLSPQLGINTSL